MLDRYNLSSVNAQKQVEIAAEHEHAHTLEDSEKEKKDGCNTNISTSGPCYGNLQPAIALR